ncbi:MAG TPA: sialidase family protein [Woeseiaceae bacterium]|nr:sialidase family protein [Woeseiaceae bacterium]
MFLNAEVEPFLAVNPSSPANLIAVWQQDRWSNGGALGIMTGVSFDEGQTWTLQALPFSRCAGGTTADGGNFDRATDPWVTFSPDGVAYELGQTFTGAVRQAGSSSAMRVSRSLDGGLAWSTPVTLILDGDAAFNDKGSITADPFDSRFVYAVWDRIDSADHGPTYFTRTTDAGESWEAPRSIYDAGPSDQTLNNQIVVLPDGTLIDCFTRFHTATDASSASTMTAIIGIVRSPDRGASWSSLLKVDDALSVGVDDPETGARIRSAAFIASIAVAPDGGLWVAWQDGRFSGFARDAIAITHSIDGGLNWSEPVQVNGDPSVPAFLPTVSVAIDGTIAVSYYDLRANTSDPNTLPTEYRLARSTDGIVWTDTSIAGPFDLRMAPNASGLFLGDYQALRAIGTSFMPLFVQTTGAGSANRTDVFTVPMPLSSGASAAEGFVHAAKAALPVSRTPESARKVSENVVRTLKQRLPGRAAALP